MTAGLMHLYDQQVRNHPERGLPATWEATWVGPLLRATAPTTGIAFAKDLDALPVAELDDLLVQLRNYYSERGLPVEFKAYGHDRADLPERLHLAGFRAEATEAVMLADSHALILDAAAPPGVVIREAAVPHDFRRIADLQTEVWGADWSWLEADLAQSYETSAGAMRVLVAEVDENLISAAWLVGKSGTEFAGLWGGSTLPQWRKRGVYRALVAQRAALAREMGYRYLNVDASADSRPILERLGFTQGSTTTPWVWAPVGSQ